MSTKKKKDCFPNTEIGWFQNFNQNIKRNNMHFIFSLEFSLKPTKVEE